MCTDSHNCAHNVSPESIIHLRVSEDLFHVLHICWRLSLVLLLMMELEVYKLQR